MIAPTLTTRQLDERLREAGVHHFSALEVTRLQNAGARRRVGAATVADLPAVMLDTVIALALFLEIVRARASEISGRDHKVSVLGWYRPGADDSGARGWRGDYNVACGGSKGSSHERAAGVDLRSGTSQADLSQALLEVWRDTPWAAGLGTYAWGRRHVDLVHGDGKLARHWKSPLVSRQLGAVEIGNRVKTQRAALDDLGCETVRPPSGVWMVRDFDSRIVVADMARRLR